MRRYVFVILFFVVLVTPFVLRNAVGTTSSQPKPVATSGEPLKLVIVTAHVEGIRREFDDAFVAWHAKKYGQRVDIDWRNYGAAQIVKLFETSRVSYDTFGNYGSSFSPYSVNNPYAATPPLIV